MPPGTTGLARQLVDDPPPRPLAPDQPRLPQPGQVLGDGRDAAVEPVSQPGHRRRRLGEGRQELSPGRGPVGDEDRLLDGIELGLGGEVPNPRAGALPVDLAGVDEAVEVVPSGLVVDIQRPGDVGRRRAGIVADRRQHPVAGRCPRLGRVVVGIGGVGDHGMTPVETLPGRPG